MLSKELRKCLDNAIESMTSKEMKSSIDIFEIVLFELPVGYIGPGVEFLEYLVNQMKKRIENES